MYLAVESAGVSDIFLSNVGIHWSHLSGKEKGKVGRGWCTAEALGDLADSARMSQEGTLGTARIGMYLSGLKVPSVSATKQQ